MFDVWTDDGDNALGELGATKKVKRLPKARAMRRVAVTGTGATYAPDFQPYAVNVRAVTPPLPPSMFSPSPGWSPTGDGAVPHYAPTQPRKFDSITNLINRGFDIYNDRRAGTVTLPNGQIVPAGGGAQFAPPGGYEGGGEQGDGSARGAGREAGDKIGGAFEGIVEFVKNNPLIVGGLAVMLYLKQSQPVSRR